MSRIRFAVVIALALVPVVPGLAQDSPEASPPPAEENPAPSSGDSTAPERETPPARDDSPYDYQASEEISEDLSVSFPVDI
jgi:hypothetical protein